MVQARSMAWSRKELRSVKSQRMVVLSLLPAATVWPSGANATEVTELRWPLSKALNRVLSNVWTRAD
jgi:hypothetical protein